MKVKVEKTTIDDVRAFIVTPDAILPNNRHRVLIHMHGGCYVFSPGESGLAEAVMMAGFGGFRVISVDYRMPPEAYFPAALDDGVTVYKHVLRTIDPKHVAIFGASAGGALTLEIVLRAKQEGIPVPAAIAPGTPMSDVTGVGDSFYTNELVDNVLVSRDGLCQAAAQYYAAGHDMKDPLISPVYGDMAGFPPTILTRKRHSPRSAASSISIWPSRNRALILGHAFSTSRMPLEFQSRGANLPFCDANL
jgi:acetyl esterase/lipase